MVGEAVMESGFMSAAALDSIYGQGAAERVREARVLVIGAGGVGCELVKNLACTGFGSITMVDLDTIDVSNLNRQFLFRKHHVGKSKAIEAAASIIKMVPGTRIKGLVGNVKEPRFGVSFFKDFALVCNALDNLEARRHVNRMCLAANVPLVESGSTGYQGQVSVIGPDVECYDCTERIAPKSYAVCTIRSTPDKPVHCVVWAKYLFDLIFGPDDESNVLKDLDGGGADGAVQDPDVQVNGRSSSEEQPGNVSNAKSSEVVDEGSRKLDRANSREEQDEETATVKSTPKAKRVRFSQGESSEGFASRVCDRVFVDDIKSQIAMKDLWKERPPPTVYDVNAVANDANEDVQHIDLLSQSEWSKERSAAVFKATLKGIVDKRSKEIGSLTFDKDDQDALAFVTSASNLRAHAYGVPLQSPFAVKGIAGNIIHAVATTNAMVGGLVVLEALKVVVNSGKLHDNKTTYVSQAPTDSIRRARKILVPSDLKPPNKKCFVCSRGQLHLSIDVHKTTLQTLVSAVLQKHMSVVQPSVHVSAGEYHNTLYECGSGLEEDEIEVYKGNLEKTLHSLRVEDGSQLVVEDFAQNFTCTLHVSNVSEIFSERAETERFSLDGAVPVKKENGSTDERKKDDGSVDVDDEALEVPVTVTREEPRPASATNVLKAKSANESAGAEVMEVDKIAVASKKRALEEAANGHLDNAPEAKRARSDAEDAEAV